MKQLGKVSYSSGIREYTNKVQFEKDKEHLRKLGRKFITRTSSSSKYKYQIFTL